MGAMNASAWLLPAWRRSLAVIGASAEDERIEAAGRRLIERWSDPDRKHHNLRRLVSVLARVDELAAETHGPDLVRVAAWYHGAVFRMDDSHVYSRRGGIDEIASSQLARSELTGLGVPEESIARVVELIHALARHHVPDGDLDAMALCDANLGGLAVEPQKYATYRREVREEYSEVPDLDYFRARIAIIEKLLGRAKLFTSPLGQAWEERARENLTAERARVSAQLAKLSGAPAPTAEPPAREMGAHPERSFFAGAGPGAGRSDPDRPAGTFAPLPSGSIPRIPGSQGSQGAQGSTDSPGSQGPSGSQGSPVPSRSQGSPVPSGSQGSPGSQGPSGSPGSPGSPATPRDRADTRSAGSVSSPASPTEELRPLVKDYPKGRPLGPKLRRIDALPRSAEARGPSGSADAAAPPERGGAPSTADSPDEGSTMTRPPRD
ncbi:hypothetical protein GCG21_00340 [Pseudactinotalea sp. HY160]|uniref:HD domain-containing protein n=1 Tax=Pseudactinotalea sp. HY160 TaxID=2654490 RepID=UPI00128B8B67|nr:hypothetical protein [Pseudactinotalea sp. HY160]MPV48481.1 hypothetical protein [Pseudactinotalea sp. HY160]